MCLVLTSFIVALGIMDSKTMHYAETRMAQMSLQVWSRRVREILQHDCKMSTQTHFRRKELHYVREEAANQETVAGLEELSSCVEKKKSWKAVLSEWSCEQDQSYGRKRRFGEIGDF